MKKTGKRILYTLLILVGIVVLFFGYFGIRFWLAIRDLTPAETQKINDSVFCIKDQFANAFVFRTGADYILVDAGNDVPGVKAGLDQLGVNPAAVSTVLLTHTDADHVGAMSLFPNAKVYMHKDEKQMVDGTNGKFFFLRAQWKYQPYILLADRDSLRFGNLKITLIHAPGHTPGSCCWLVGKDYLCTGDNISWKEGKMGHFTDFFNMDTKQQEASIERIPELKSIPILLTAHHGIIRQK